jgi:hypothetical protein
LKAPWESFDLKHELTDKGIKKFVEDYKSTLAPAARPLDNGRELNFEFTGPRSQVRPAKCQGTLMMLILGSSSSSRSAASNSLRPLCGTKLQIHFYYHFESNPKPCTDAQKPGFPFEPPP